MTDSQTYSTDGHPSRGSTAGLTAPVRPFMAEVLPNRGRLALVLTAIVYMSNWTVATAAETAHDGAATLYADNGDYVPGRFVPLKSDGQICWKSHLFAEPITFNITGLDKITFGLPPKPRVVRKAPSNSNRFVKALNKVLEAAATPLPAKTTGIEGSRVQLTGPNVFFGEVMSLDDDFLTLRSERHNVVRFHRSAVRQIEGLSSNKNFLFDGIGDFRSCLCLGNGRSVSDWDRSGVGLSTKTKGANLYHELSHFGSYVIELELTATRTPVFHIGLGASRDLSRLKQSFSIEVWSNKLLTAHRQVGDTLQRATLGEPAFLNNRRTMNLEIYFNHETGHLAVYTRGELLGEFQSEADLDVLGNGIFLRNNGSNLNVTRFRVRKWNGTPPKSQAKDGRLIRSADGDWIAGEVVAISRESQQVTIKTDEGERTVELSEVDHVAFPNPRLAPFETPELNLKVDYLDGSHIEGQLVRVSDDGIEIQFSASPDPITLGWDNIFQVTFPGRKTKARDAVRSPGLLEVTGCRLHGRVVNANEEGIVLWAPANSDTPVPINLSSKARVTFEPSDAARSRLELNDQLHLVNGDTIPCELISIDEQAVRVRFADGEMVAVPGDVFKAINRHPPSSHIYNGFGKGDRWYANRVADGCYEFENGALNLIQPVLLARDVNLPDRVRISFDARWSGHNVVLVGFGANSPKNAIQRRVTSFTQEMIERESKKKPDYFGEFMITRQGKSLTARGYTRSAGPLGQMFLANQFMMSTGLRQTASIALGANATAHIEVLIDRIRREYAIVANGRQLFQWKDSTKVDGGTIHIGVQQLNQSGRNAKQTQIGAVQLLNLRVSRWPGAIPDDKLERLLTRRLGARPKVTTHILRAFNGDSLRGRLISVQDNVVTFEARLDTFTIPLDKIAEIVSLNEIVVEEPRTKNALFRTALQGGGSVTIKPVAVTDTLMIGESPLIGKTSVPWHLVSALDFGAKQSARESALASWKLRSPPPLPNAPTPDEQLPSPLIGKPAPDIELTFLDNEYVQLADLKGRIVILDFWATWCGPCLASMPALMDIATEFHDQGVEFIAVNQQEDPDDVLEFLATRGWDLKVALDSDALISRRYGVAGIPFTVIIDKAGIVRQVHLGAAANLEQTLRTELQELLSSSKTGEVAPADSASTEPT